MSVKSFKYRIYPNADQCLLFTRTFGHSRFIYNTLLGKVVDEYQTWKKDNTQPKPNISSYGFSKSIPHLKKEHDWLEEVSSVALQQRVMDLGKAFTNFFNVKTSGYPKFKNKHGKQSFRLVGPGFKFNNNLLYVAKSHTPIKLRGCEGLPSNPTSVTITKNAAGQYFASLVCEADPVLTNGSEVIGVDLGIKDLAILSTGEVIPNPRHLKQKEKTLARKQRQLSRKVKGSKNRNKARLNVAKLHVQIADTRKDFLHKLSRRLVNENQVIGLESLRPANMIRNRKLAKHIADVSWGMLNRFIVYKAIDSMHCNVVYMHTFFPSSHICSVCNTKLDRKLDLKERSWACPICHSRHDRDVNASTVIGKVADWTARQTPSFGKVHLAPNWDQLLSLNMFTLP